jgi:hypothetical protein
VKLDGAGIRETVSEVPQHAWLKTDNSFPLNQSTRENRACMRGLSNRNVSRPRITPDRSSTWKKLALVCSETSHWNALLNKNH